MFSKLFKKEKVECKPEDQYPSSHDRLVLASVRRDGHATLAMRDGRQAREAAIIKRRLNDMGVFHGNLYGAINEALEAGKIPQERADRWHAIRKADNHCKHNQSRLDREKKGGGGSGGGSGGGGAGGRRKRRRRGRKRE